MHVGLAVLLVCASGDLLTYAFHRTRKSCLEPHPTLPERNQMVDVLTPLSLLLSDAAGSRTDGFALIN